MKNKHFHKNFQLNGRSFSSSKEIVAFSKDISDSVHDFLEDWFSSDDGIVVQTSGSTGKPKSIRLKKESMRNSALATGAFFDLQENTTALLCLPIDFIAGKMMLVRALTLGWVLDIIEPDAHPLTSIEKEYGFSAMVPMQLQNSLDKIHHIKKLIVGGGVISKELEVKTQNLSTAIFATYGMTETITHIAVKKINHFKNSSSNAVERYFYKTLPDITIYKDQRNCLVVEAPKISDELIFTNDIVQLISDTQFEWLGRFDNVINSGGIKLHPEQIEKKLSLAISERFFVAGVPDKVLGEKLILIVEGNQRAIDLDNIDNLSKYEIPKEIYFVNAFVETETKKVQRKETLGKMFPN